MDGAARSIATIPGRGEKKMGGWGGRCSPLDEFVSAGRYESWAPPRSSPPMRLFFSPSRAPTPAQLGSVSCYYAWEPILGGGGGNKVQKKSWGVGIFGCEGVVMG